MSPLLRIMSRPGAAGGGGGASPSSLTIEGVTLTIDGVILTII